MFFPETYIFQIEYTLLFQGYPSIKSMTVTRHCLCWQQITIYDRRSANRATAPHFVSSVGGTLWFGTTL